MRMTIYSSLLLAALAAGSAKAAVAEKPNVLIIYADDIGRGDLSCWGQQHFKTPNIDKLATQGMQFEHFYGCTVCAPARAGLLTGNTNARSPIPNKGGLECKLAAGLITQDEFDAGVTARRSQRPGSYFMGHMAQAAGYHTSYFGKLGIGYTETDELIRSYGFDYHCGLYDSVICWGFYPEYYWENGVKIPLPTNPKFDRATPHCPVVGKEDMVYTEDIWLAKCKDYLAERAKANEPFLAIYATQLPHGPASIPPKDHLYKDRTDWEPKERVYASMVEKLDRSVGELLAQLKTLKLAENTVVIFMGDNGHEPDCYTVHHPDGMLNGFWDGHQRGEDRFNGTLGQRGVKRSNHEGGLNVPFIIRWLGQIEAGTGTKRRTAVYDILPTLAEMLEVEIPVEIEGLSFLPTLTGNGKQQGHQALFWMNTTGASKETVIAGDWKLIREIDREKSTKKPRNVVYRSALYNLKEDAFEKNDLSAEMPEMTDRLEQMIKEWLKR